MHHFRYIADHLYCEEVDLAAVARLYGTPTYVYSAATVSDQVARLRRSFGELDVRICYAVKANSSLALLRLLAKLGVAFDLVSGGELRRVHAAGADVQDCVLAGVGKTEAEIRLALEQRVFALHVESEPELARINYVAGQLGVRAPIGLRINPDVDAQTHAKITTGTRDNKFGIAWEQAPRVFELAAKLPHLQVRGIQMHLGSQLTSEQPFVEAVKKLAPLVEKLKQTVGLEYFSIGGGLGIPYEDALASGDPGWWAAGSGAADRRRVLAPEVFGAAVAPLLAPLGLKILLEPGRFLVGNAGVLLARVEYLKRGPSKNFLVLDAGMNDLVRPAMYDGYHELVPLHRDTTRPAMVADVVGPVCESSDCFGRDRKLQQVGEGEWMAFMSAGAYSFAMANRYNSRPLPAEVLVQGAAFELIRPRERFEDTIAGERLPEFLS